MNRLIMISFLKAAISLENSEYSFENLDSKFSLKELGEKV